MRPLLGLAIVASIALSLVAGSAGAMARTRIEGTAVPHGRELLSAEGAYFEQISLGRPALLQPPSFGSLGISWE